MQEKINKLKQLKILFVEDEEDLLSIISDALTKLQANFVTAVNGVDALEVIEANSDIDIIVTDINMPHMNGLELLEKLSNKGIKIPVIIMSAHTETEYINQAKDYGVTEYLLKPFDFIEFIDLVASLDLKK